jgi:hypothetical protein
MRHLMGEGAAPRGRHASRHPLDDWAAYLAVDDDDEDSGEDDGGEDGGGEEGGKDDLDGDGGALATHTPQLHPV